MLKRFFALSENQTTFRKELLAGLTTFLTMAYIIFVQPAVLSGAMFGKPTGLDFGAVTTATCLSAAIASAIMGLYARYPIAQAPGMGQNFSSCSAHCRPRPRPDSPTRGKWCLGSFSFPACFFCCCHSSVCAKR